MEHTSILVARSLWQALAAAGLRHVVLSPGSRNAPLGYAAAGAQQGELNAPDLSLTVRVDERAAAFTALGMALASGEPVAVVTTSGTAAANLHPAVLEAHHSGVPLIIITADRPHNLRGTGANQTTKQVGLFDEAVRLTVDLPTFAAPFNSDDRADLQAVAARLAAGALGKLDGRPGPVHLNIAFADPLYPVNHEWPTDRGATGTWVAGRPSAPPATHADLPNELAELLNPQVPGVVVAGNDAGPGARELAEQLGWPLLAEPSSGARSGPNAIVAYSRVLAGSGLAEQTRAAVVLGHPTLTRPVQRLLADPEVTVALIHPGGLPWLDAPRRARFVLPAVPQLPHVSAGEPNDWLAQWQQAGAEELHRQLEQIAPLTHPGSRLSSIAVTKLVAEASGAEDLLVVGSSNPIRHLDLLAAWDTATAPRVLANRGLAGIDGTLGTAIGAALVHPGAQARVLLGDLSFLHDAGSLLIGTAEERPNLQVVVINNEGGAIFSDLEHGAVARSSPEFAAQVSRVMTTPQQADLGAIARGYGAEHVLVETVEQLRAALAEPAAGLSVVEARVYAER